MSHQHQGSFLPRHFVQGALCVVGSGVFWAVLTHELHQGGHAPSRVLLPVAREEYYRLQSLFVVPVLLVLWGVLTGVAHVLTRGHGLTGAKAQGSARELVGLLGFAYGLPLLLAFLLPEWIAYGIFGIEGLRQVVRFTAPLTALVTCVLVAWVLRAVRAVTWRRAAVAAVAAVLAQAALGAPFLR
jgi:hypothetical protein